VRYFLEWHRFHEVLYKRFTVQGFPSSLFELLRAGRVQRLKVKGERLKVKG
jgi:hypothetical protein